MIDLFANTQNITIQRPLVSICCLTYNQEKYISQTIESFLMQRTSFSYEIIIHDDASTDNTKEIIEKYALEFPDIIKPVFQDQNKFSVYGLGYLFNYITSIANGKYITMCGGDDYWIDPRKLEKQVGFLEENDDYGLVHTKSVIFSERDNSLGGTHGAKVDNFESLLFECSIAALTVCVRTNLLKKYIEEVKPETHTKWTAEDFPAWLWVMMHSKFKFLDDYTAVYRNRLGSISHIKDDYKRLEFSEGIYDVVDYYLSNYPKDINENKIKARYYSNMISLYFLTRQWSGIKKSTKIFYNANDWLNLLWIAMTLPFFYSRFIIKGSYRVRSIVFNLFNIYPIRK